MLGLYRDNGKENGNYRNYRDYIRIYWGYIGIMEKPTPVISQGNPCKLLCRTPNTPLEIPMCYILKVPRVL